MKISKIKKLSLHHHSNTAVSRSTRAWLTIVFVGFGLLVLSIAFHAWLFFSSGKAVASSSSVLSASVETIDRTRLNSILSRYETAQSEKALQSQTDAALKDPSK